MKKSSKIPHLDTKITPGQGEKGSAKNNENAGNYRSFDVN